MRDREKDMEEEGGAQREGGPVINYLAYPTSPTQFTRIAFKSRSRRTTSKRGRLELHSNAEKSERNLTAVYINAIPLQSKLNCNRTEFALYGSRIGWSNSQFKRNSEFNYLECSSNAVGLFYVATASMTETER